MNIKRNKRGQFLKGEKNTSWQGGRSGDGQGYIRVWKPDHPNNNHGYVLEHRLVMEYSIGRFLTKKEVVHHINGVKNDNRIENLIIMTRHIHPANHFIGTHRSELTKEKIRTKLQKHPVSKSTRKKLRDSMKNRYKRGEKIGFQKGNKHGY